MSLFERHPKFVFDTGPSQGHTVLELGEIVDNLSKTARKYRADIRPLAGGPILEKIQLPGPFYTKKGFLSGFKIPYSPGQMVLLGNAYGEVSNKYVITVFPFTVSDLTKNNLANSGNYDPKEVKIGHESGHSTSWDDDKVTFDDKKDKERIKIDYTSKKITLTDWTIICKDSSGNQVKIAGGNVIAMAQNPGTQVSLTGLMVPTTNGPAGPPIPGS